MQIQTTKKQTFLPGATESILDWVKSEIDKPDFTGCTIFKGEDWPKALGQAITQNANKVLKVTITTECNQ